MQLTTIPMPGMTPTGIRPAGWAPAPYRPAPSPFMAQPRRRMGQIFGSSGLFSHPAVELVIDAGVITLAYYATKQKEFKGHWRTLAWAVLIASGVKALNDVVMLFSSTPPPAPVEVPVQVTPVAP